MREGAVGPYPCDFPSLEAPGPPPFSALTPPVNKLRGCIAQRRGHLSFTAKVWVLHRERSFVNKLMGQPATACRPPAASL